MGVKPRKKDGGLVMDDYPIVAEYEGGSIILAQFDKLINWARSNSLWPLTFGTRCCAIEFMAAGASRHDFARFGAEVARATPRQADLIIISGSINYKMAPVLKRLYDQIADPKWVIAMGACAVSGGPFFYNSYAIVKGADHVVPVDVYIPGCPPRPEALLYGIMQLQKKIRAERNYSAPKSK
jgi:NADH-quinone oxidoreductase subunit B